MVDCTDMVTELTTKMIPAANKKKIKLLFEPPEYSLVIESDPVLLARLLSNLIDNSIKYTEKGSVKISLSRKDARVIITIVDTGTGMTKKQLDNAFERFYRTESSRTTKGFGLGLAICKAVTIQLGGDLHLASKPGVGTRARVTLPSSKHK